MTRGGGFLDEGFGLFLGCTEEVLDRVVGGIAAEEAGDLLAVDLLVVSGSVRLHVADEVEEGRTLPPTLAMIDAKRRSLTAGSCQLTGMVALLRMLACLYRDEQPFLLCQCSGVRNKLTARMCTSEMRRSVFQDWTGCGTYELMMLIG